MAIASTSMLLKLDGEDGGGLIGNSGSGPPRTGDWAGVGVGESVGVGARFGAAAMAAVKEPISASPPLATMPMPTAPLALMLIIAFRCSARVAAIARLVRAFWSRRMATRRW